MMAPDALGNEPSVQKLQVADLKAFHHILATPNNCVLAIYGDVKADKVRAAVEKSFGKWKQVGRVTPCAPPDGSQRTAIPTTKRISEARDKKRAEDEKAWKLRHAELEEAITVLVHTVDEWIRNNPRSNGGPGSVQKS